MARAGRLALAVVFAACAAALYFHGRSDAADFRLPRGSLARSLPSVAALPPAPASITPELHPPIPTNRWWSSLVALPFSERQYPHPLAVAARAEGFQVRYPGPDIHANEACICGWMEPEPP